MLWEGLHFLVPEHRIQRRPLCNWAPFYGRKGCLGGSQVKQNGYLGALRHNSLNETGDHVCHVQYVHVRFLRVLDLGESKEGSRSLVQSPRYIGMSIPQTAWSECSCKVDCCIIRRCMSSSKLRPSLSSNVGVVMNCVKFMYEFPNTLFTVTSESKAVSSLFVIGEVSTHSLMLLLNKNPDIYNHSQRESVLDGLEHQSLSTIAPEIQDPEENNGREGPSPNPRTEPRLTHLGS